MKKKVSSFYLKFTHIYSFKAKVIGVCKFYIKCTMGLSHTKTFGLVVKFLPSSWT
jgi:hypothetical protein